MNRIALGVVVGGLAAAWLYLMYGRPPPKKMVWQRLPVRATKPTDKERPPEDQRTWQDWARNQIDSAADFVREEAIPATEAQVGGLLASSESAAASAGSTINNTLQHGFEVLNGVGSRRW